MDLGDLDGDGDLDAFVANAQVSSGTGEPNRVWLNDGDGNFSDNGQALGDSPSLGISLGDLDGDGDLDAFVANAGDFAEPGLGSMTAAATSLTASKNWGIRIAVA